MNEQKPKKISKSTKIYIFFGLAIVLFVIGLFVAYAFIAHIDILAWFDLSNKRFVMVLILLFIYSVIAIIFIVKDIIRRL